MKTISHYTAVKLKTRTEAEIKQYQFQICAGNAEQKNSCPFSPLNCIYFQLKIASTMSNKEQAAHTMEGFHQTNHHNLRAVTCQNRKVANNWVDYA